MSGRVRRVSAIVVLLVAGLLLVVGLIDPLEGGLALLGAVALLIAVRVLSQTAVPKLAWIPVPVALALGATILSLVIFARPPEPVDGAVANPLNSGVIGLLWVYRVAVLVAVAGAIQYLVRLIRAVRTPIAPAYDGPAPRPR